MLLLHLQEEQTGHTAAYAAGLITEVGCERTHMVTRRRGCAG
jgi:hypothetical protein